MLGEARLVAARKHGRRRRRQRSAGRGLGRASGAGDPAAGATPTAGKPVVDVPVEGDKKVGGTGHPGWVSV
jgi:hypothetical protein